MFDAGKTSLTERLLHIAGVIDEVGSVDDGNTQTDSLTLERQPGITIKSAVVSFAVDDLTINLIDTLRARTHRPFAISEAETLYASIERNIRLPAFRLVSSGPEMARCGGSGHGPVSGACFRWLQLFRMAPVGSRAARRAVASATP